MRKLALLLAGFTIFNLSFSAVENIETGDVYLFGDGGDAKNLEAKDTEKGLSLDEFDIPEDKDKSKNKKREDKFEIGLAMILGSKEYKGDDAEFTFFPLLDIKYNNFYIDKTIAGVNIFEKEDLKFSLVGEYNMMGYEASKLEGGYADYLSDAKHEVQAGFGIKFLPLSTSNIEVDFRLTRDFSNKSEGFKVHVEGSKSMQYSQTIEMVPSIYYTMLSEDMINYYYGVTEDQKNNADSHGVSINSYSADNAGYIIGVGFDLDYYISPSIVLKSFNKAEILSSEIVSSPIVESSFNIEIGAGFVLSL